MSVVSNKILSKEANQKTVGSDDHIWFSTKTKLSVNERGITAKFKFIWQSFWGRFKIEKFTYDKKEDGHNEMTIYVALTYSFIMWAKYAQVQIYL